MAVFEIKVNGQERFRGDEVTAITIVSDLISRRDEDRIAMHIGTGGPGERETHHLAADLAVGDEITIRVLGDDGLREGEYPAPDRCSFCGSPSHAVRSLVAERQKAICESCLSSFSAFVLGGAALPVGARLQENSGELTCAFCEKAPPEVPALLVRNDAAICPGCLRSCVDVDAED